MLYGNSKDREEPKWLWERIKCGGLTLPDFKTYKVIVTKTVWYWCQDGQTG